MKTNSTLAECRTSTISSHCLSTAGSPTSGYSESVGNSRVAEMHTHLGKLDAYPQPPAVSRIHPCIYLTVGRVPAAADRVGDYAPAPRGCDERCTPTAPQHRGQGQDEAELPCLDANVHGRHALPRNVTNWITDLAADRAHRCRRAPRPDRPPRARRRPVRRRGLATRARRTAR